ncbi:MAG TPA: hypothetical protein VF753_20295, partial [Terriglobales bacterium]
MSSRLLCLSAFCLLALIALSNLSAAQTYCPNAASGSMNVTTWHNDTNRTGWQCNETTLNQSNVNQSKFGLLMQWPVTGSIYAQPLAVYHAPTDTCIPSPCSIVYVATEQDYLYAFNTQNGSDAWGLALAPLNLATLINSSYTSVSCPQGDSRDAPLCTAPVNPQSNQYIGVTGTPVIDPGTSTLYVVAAVCTNCPPPAGNQTEQVAYYLLALNYLTGALQANIEITNPSTVTVQTPGMQCSAQHLASPTGFNPNTSLQRQALLLATNPNNGENYVYVAFSDYPEMVANNGWIFAYYLQNNGGTYSFTQPLAAAPTPTGGQGGLWGAGSGPAVDATGGSGGTAPYQGSIYLSAANGYYDGTLNWGDSLMRLYPKNQSTFWPPADWYTPYDVNSYNTNGKQYCQGLSLSGRCNCDMDLSSGGVMIVPSAYTYTCNTANGNTCTNNQCTGSGCNVVITADKESKIYVSNQVSLGYFSSSGGNNIEVIQTPPPYQDTGGSQQGYWASPAYWYDGTSNWIFYNATDAVMGDAPLSLFGYVLATGGNVPSTSTPVPPSTSAAQSWTFNNPNSPPGGEAVGFCNYAPTPSISSQFKNGAVDPKSGIVWVIENPN